MKISIASDHAGIHHKEYITEEFLTLEKYEVIDFGCHDTHPVDYVDIGLPAVESVAEGKSDIAILICGSGQGMNIIANKVKGIRAALCFNTEFAQLARDHNNANVLCLPARFISFGTAMDIIEVFLKTPFSEKESHTNRVRKITEYENFKKDK